MKACAACGEEAPSGLLYVFKGRRYCWDCVHELRDGKPYLGRVKRAPPNPHESKPDSEAQYEGDFFEQR